MQLKATKTISSQSIKIDDKQEQNALFIFQRAYMLKY